MTCNLINVHSKRDGKKEKTKKKKNGKKVKKGKKERISFCEAKKKKTGESAKTFGKINPHQMFIQSFFYCFDSLRTLFIFFYLANG